VEQLKKVKLTPNQMLIIYLIYYKQFENISEIFGKLEALKIRNSLVNTQFILSGANQKFTETILSNKHVEKLLDIRIENINFWEFYNCYPIKIGSRVLRSSGSNSQIALKHEKKYLSRVKTKERHELAIKSITVFVSKQKQANKLEFLPNMETVMNNSMWEQWEVFIEETGKEGQEWFNETI
jgi:uncharacterized HAD superfamily protein